MKMKATKNKKQQDKETEPQDANLRISYSGTLGAASEGDREIVAAIRKWLPAFESIGQDSNDLVWAMLHCCANDEGLESYMDGFLEGHLEPGWKFNPWTGEAIPSDEKTV